MSLTYGFYDSVNGDRVYNALQMSSIFDGIIKDGVFASIGKGLAVRASGTDLEIIVGNGKAWFNHTWTNLDADLTLALAPASLVNPRIDRIVLEINATDNIRSNSIKILTGAPSPSPVPPSLTNTEFVHQYPLANISVPVNLTTVTNSHITSLVGTAACPFITGVLSVITNEAVVAKWEADFVLWFDTIKDMLSTDAAGNLQMQLFSHNHSTVLETKIVTDSLTDGSVTPSKLSFTTPVRLAQISGDDVIEGFDFTNISGSYSKLVIDGCMRIISGVTSGVPLNLKFNNDVTANYDMVYFSTYFKQEVSFYGITHFELGFVPVTSNPAGRFMRFNIEIPFYALGTMNRVAVINVVDWSTDNNFNIPGTIHGVWNNTSAINRITIFTTGGPIKTGSVATLYGIP